MKNVLRAVFLTGALLASVLTASTTTASAGAAPPTTFNELYRSIPMTVNGDYTPIFGAQCGAELGAFIFWYAPGGSPDYLWEITGLDPFTYTSKAMPVNGTYEPIVGDFDGNDCDDILWYAPGGAADHIWWGELDGSFSSAPMTINGTYEPVSGRFGDDDLDDVFWYSPGSGAEYLWAGVDDRTFASRKGPNVNGTYDLEPLVSNILFHKPGSGTDYVWTDLDAKTGSRSSHAVNINGTYRPEATFYGWLLYGPGSSPDYLMYDWADDGTPMSVPGTINGTYVDDVRSPRAYIANVWHAPGAAQDYLWVPEGLGDASADSFGSAEAPTFPRRG